MLTKSPFPIYKEKKLTNPQRAQSWSPQGILFEGSSVSALPVGMTRLPEKSSLLEKLVKGGVEAHSDGRMYGQVSVFHGCGNDPVGEDIRRVEIARWLAFFEQGQTTFKPHFVAYEGGPISAAEEARPFHMLGWWSWPMAPRITSWSQFGR
jgi:hypothetical protein